MKSLRNSLFLGLGASLLLAGCNKMQIPKNASEATQSFDDAVKQVEPYTKYIPGDPRNQHHWEAPEKVDDFQVLYRQNCQGCHSFGEGVSASIALDNPTYLSWIPREKMREIIVNGVSKTAMPAWGKKGGGPLTDDQIDILVNNFMLKKPATPPAGLPPYEAGLGNAANGETLLNAVYGPEKAKDWINPSFLALVSNQYLRTLLVVGRPELGEDMSKVKTGAPLSAQEISDVVAWLASKRPGAAMSTAPSDINEPPPTHAAPATKPKGGL